MYDLYAMSSPNAVRIVLALEELEAPYRLHHVDVWRGEQHGEAYRRINPNGKVPALVDPDGPGERPYTVFESGAILIYLAEKAGRLLAREGAERYDALQWLAVTITGVGPMFGQYVHFLRFATSANEYARARYTSEALRLVELFDERLAASPFLGGEAFSIADIAAFPWLDRLQPVNLMQEPPPNLARWLAAVRARPGVTRGLARHAQMMPVDQANREAATPHDLDRMFGRGRFERTA